MNINDKKTTRFQSSIFLSFGLIAALTGSGCNGVDDPSSIALGDAQSAGALSATNTASTQVEDASVQVAFDGAVNLITQDSDGSFLAAGSFSNGKGLVRVSAEGAQDENFSKNLGLSFNGLVTCVRIQSDRKILVGGEFTDFNGNPVGRILRLTQEGLLDQDFVKNAGTGFNDRVTQIIPLPDGSILVFGSFTSFGAQSFLRAAKLDANGNPDLNFGVPEAQQPILSSAPGTVDAVTQAPASADEAAQSPTSEDIAAQASAPAEVVTQTTAPAEVVTQAPAPAEVVTQTTVPAEVVTQTPARTPAAAVSHAGSNGKNEGEHGSAGKAEESKKSESSSGKNNAAEHASPKSKKAD